MKKVRNYVIWLFYYLIGVVPLNLTVNRIDFVYSYPSESYVLLNVVLYGIIFCGLVVSWYLVANVLEQIHIQRFGNKEVNQDA